MTTNKSISVLMITVIVASMISVAPFSIDTYLPAFPSIAYELGASAVQMQHSMSIYMLGFAIMTLFCGSISDALGRRSVAMVAMFVFAAASLACVFVDTIEHFLWLRFVQGLAASVGVVVGRALVRDLFDGANAQRVMSNAMMFFAIAPAIAPIIGGLLEVGYGWRSVFIFLMLLGLLLAVIIILRLPETLPLAERQSMHPIKLLKNYTHAITHVRFTTLALVVAFNFGGFFLYITSSPRIMFTHLGYSAADFHILFVPLVAGVMLGSFASGRLSGRITPLATIIIGICIMFSAALLNLLLANVLLVSPLGVIAPVVLYASGMSLSMPALMLLGLDQLPQHRGLASSLQSFLQMSMNALIAGIVTPFVFNSLSQIALTMLQFQLIGMLLFILIYRGLRGAQLDPATASRDNR